MSELEVAARGFAANVSAADEPVRERWVEDLLASATPPDESGWVRFRLPMPGPMRIEQLFLERGGPATPAFEHQGEAPGVARIYLGDWEFVFRLQVWTLKTTKETISVDAWDRVNHVATYGEDDDQGADQRYLAKVQDRWRKLDLPAPNPNGAQLDGSCC